jgi:hypothetical protein
VLQSACFGQAAVPATTFRIGINGTIRFILRWICATGMRMIRELIKLPGADRAATLLFNAFCGCLQSQSLKRNRKRQIIAGNWLLALEGRAQSSNMLLYYT